MNSYTSENILKLHKRKCENNDITTIRTSSESHIQWKKKHFHKNRLFFRIYADFEADNEKDNSSIGNKTTNIYKQNQILNVYHIVYELEDVLKSGYHKSPLGYDNADWFVDEILKLEKKMALSFKNANEDIVIGEEDEEKISKIKIIADFVNNILDLIKLEIIVIWQDHTAELLIVNVILL